MGWLLPIVSTKRADDKGHLQEVCCNSVETRMFPVPITLEGCHFWTTVGVGLLLEDFLVERYVGHQQFIYGSVFVLIVLI